MSLTEMPLFPLNTVLFPGGVLPLRIFEPRYLSMIGERMRGGAGFGVVLIREGHEAGGPADFFATGTVAEIVDFDQLKDGMLGVTCRGGRVVRVQNHRRQPDRLVIGEVELLEAEPAQPLPDRYAPLADFLRQVLERREAQSYRHWLIEDWNSAAWIGYRLAELLPLTTTSKQALLETDVLQRLAILQAVIKDNRLLGDDRG